jgi:hypothetical protein
MQKIEPRALKIGDMICLNPHSAGIPKFEKVEKVEHFACSKGGTHVNSRACYDWSVLVTIGI